MTDKKYIKIRNFSFLPDPNRASLVNNYKPPSYAMMKKNPVNFLFPTESACQIFPSRLLSRRRRVLEGCIKFFCFPFQIKKSNMTREYNVRARRCVGLWWQLEFIKIRTEKKNQNCFF